MLKSISIRDLKNNNNNKIKNYFTIQKVILSILQFYFTIYPTSQFLIIFHITFNTIQFFFFFLIAPPPTTIIAHHNIAKQRMIHSKTTHSHSKTTYRYPFTTTKPIKSKTTKSESEREKRQREKRKRERIGVREREKRRRERIEE